MPAQYSLRDERSAPQVAAQIIADFPFARIFALHGDLGAGKTTLIKGFCDALGAHDQASSPTFSIVNEYRSEHGGPVYHFDLYRLKDADELQGIGFTEYIDSGAYCFIEWPELAADLLPPGTLRLTLEVAPDTVRTISISR
ncbi:MAG: tRNA (adenosine(37)-N6)-threonylcarbamoyltransferase complex ATPase subunit type 1 TsaE [Flavobacteriales bacterium]|jgi:tRNA threonylcarbamoyladenosine biosynthesis protein TsaE|nr:tRNA (adenosine(37)-N6)-threonylcarbamoyltransferase complex ATPase subunit type 1 TsaE [Flavobacteriales bacterium]